MVFSPISITGLGVISCAGETPETFWVNARDGKTSIAGSGLGTISDSVLDSVRETLRRRLPESASLSKPALLTTACIDAAMKQAGWDQLNDDDGLIIASTVGQIPLWENEMTRFLRKEMTASEFSKAIAVQSLGAIVETITDQLGFRGKSMLVTSACSASTQALALGALWIQQGKVKRCIVGGVEVLSRLTVEGFRSLQLLSAKPCKPFDQNREGINLSEGAAFFCLESPSKKRAEKTLASISGFGFSTDAYHMTAPHPEGRGSYEAMQSALQTAGLQPSEITWVHAHGTGSKANDQAEGAAIRQLFGSPEIAPWVSSTKHVHGHALGASGAIETALCLQAMKNGVVLKTAGLTDPDAAIALSLPSTNISTPIKHIVKNTLGFGGNNASLLISGAML
jgi:3-oxoacyl-(acyl-carrier-protein) synthase